MLERTIPFWLKYGIDWQHGGICTCISDEGQVQSGDKYVWSQLRAIWTFSALYNKIERKSEYLDVATHIFNFITRYGRNDRGEWYFCLDQNGRPLFDGATSIYCDGFAIYGFTEFARATGNAPQSIWRDRCMTMCCRVLLDRYHIRRIPADSQRHESTRHLDDLCLSIWRVGRLPE